MPSVSIANLDGKATHTMEEGKRDVTFAGQDKLKSLPIPTLEETCKRYLASVKPFLVCAP
jgi:Choline/Carnitine o-acyltransferase